MFIKRMMEVYKCMETILLNDTFKTLSSGATDIKIKSRMNIHCGGNKIGINMIAIEISFKKINFTI